MGRESQRRIALLMVSALGLTLFAATASAQSAASTAPLAPPAPTPTSDEAGAPRGASTTTATSAEAGMFLPFTEAPRTDTQRVFGTALGGYDGARDSGQLEGRVELTVYGPIAVRIGAIYTGSPEKARPTVGARVQALSQTGQGIDMSIGVFYKPEGFTEGEGEIEGVFAFGRRFGRVGLIGDLVYGQDPEARERDGEVRLASLYTATEHMQLGLDSRVRFDLGTEEDKLEAEGGAEYDLVAGPLISYELGGVALGGQAGLSVLGTPDTKVGPIALLSISGSM